MCIGFKNFLEDKYKMIKKAWGSYTDLYRTEDIVLKKISVDPKQRLSLQTHEKRSEFWVVTKGECLCELGDTVTRLKKWDTIQINNKQEHRLINDSNNSCEVTELQFGYCSEDDIVRIEDDYNRT